MQQISLSAPFFLEEIAKQWYNIDLKAEMKREVTPEKYERLQKGLWSYLWDLEKQGIIELFQEKEKFYFWARVYCYQKKENI